MNDYQKSNYHNFAQRLFKRRSSHTCIMPVKAEAAKFTDELLAFLFPHFSRHHYNSADEIEAKLVLIKRDLIDILKSVCVEDHLDLDAEDIADSFASRLSVVHEKLWADAEAIYKGDPAAENIDEVIFAYPGFLAIAIFRIAHEFYSLKVPFFPRILTEYAHGMTGIDIHPGASIGTSFAIDHGTGIVIGESSLIGDNVKIYQGVTLGALSVEKDMAKSKRHPTIEDDVVIYSQAVILGGDTTIGRSSVVGGNVWLTESVPPHSIIYHKSEVRMRQSKIMHGVIDFSI